MSKSMNEMAKELKVSKQKIYRYIKKHNIKESYREAGTMYFDETVQKSIYKEFIEVNDSNDMNNETIDKTVFDTLMKQIETKDIQISELTKLLDQQQHLLLMSAKNEKALEIALKEKDIEYNRKKWWKFKKREVN